MKIAYLPYHEIDKCKWDACINNATNKLIYAESFYLDMMSENWDAIVLNDYEAVMPLTWKRKFGIKYLYQPAFFQQGGIFSNKLPDKKTCIAFISTAAAQFKFAEITLNHLNRNFLKESDFKFSFRNNYVLQLNKPYEYLSKQYDIYIKQRLKRLQKFELQYKISTDYTNAIKTYKKLYKDKMNGLKNKDYEHFESLCKYYLKEKRLVVREVWDKDGENMMACALLLKDDNRLYNIASSIFTEGKRKLANYFLYDAIIKEFSGHKLSLDFEGSDIPGIAYFYKKWANENQQYPFLKWNQLPKAIQWIKK